MESPSADLAAFAVALRFEHIPAHVIDRAEDLVVDWFGSALAGKGARPVTIIDPFLVCGEPQQDGKTFRLWAKDHEGALAMDATAVIK